MAPTGSESTASSSIKSRSVMDRTEHDRDLENDPSMKRLKDMIDAKQIDQDRLIQYLEEKGKEDENGTT